MEFMLSLTTIFSLFLFQPYNPYNNPYLAPHAAAVAAANGHPHQVMITNFHFFELWGYGMLNSMGNGSIFCDLIDAIPGPGLEIGPSFGKWTK